MNKGSIVVAVLQRSWSFEPRYKLSTLLLLYCRWHYRSFWCNCNCWQTASADLSLWVSASVISRLVLYCKNYYWVEFIIRLNHLVGFGTIVQKPAVCCIMPVGMHTSLPQYPPGVWQLSSGSIGLRSIDADITTTHLMYTCESLTWIKSSMCIGELNGNRIPFSGCCVPRQLVHMVTTFLENAVEQGHRQIMRCCTHTQHIWRQKLCCCPATCLEQLPSTLALQINQSINKYWFNERNVRTHAIDKDITYNSFRHELKTYWF